MKRTLIVLFAPLALLLALQVAACGQSPAPAVIGYPGETQSGKAENTAARLAKSLIAKLEKLDALTASSSTVAQYSARTKSQIADVYKRVSRLPESDVKTDIATAARFYELSERNRKELETHETGTTRCADEKPGAYQRLCETTSGSRRQLFLAKARLHIAWAKANIDYRWHGTEDVAILREIEVERKNDQALAKRAVAALRLLEDQVVIHPSLSDFQSNEKLAEVSYETFRAELHRVSAEVENIISWLPQNRLKFEISNALYSYQDGGLRWGSVHQSKVVSVSDLAAPGFTTRSATAFQVTIPYTVAINWRQASKYLQRAEDIMGRSE